MAKISAGPTDSRRAMQPRGRQQGKLFFNHLVQLGKGTCGGQLGQQCLQTCDVAHSGGHFDLCYRSLQVAALDKPEDFLRPFTFGSGHWRV